MSLTSLNGTKVTMPGFYYEEWPFNEEYGVTNDMPLSSDFRIRVSLPEASLWKFNVTLKVGGELIDTISGSMNIAKNADNSGYLSVEPVLKRNFVFDDGTGFTAIGMNQASAIKESVQARSRYMIDWMTKAANEGANFTRMSTSQWSLGIQSNGKAPSDLSGGMMSAAQIDKIVEAWERNGMYGQIALFTHNQLNSGGGSESAWNAFPYNSATTGGYLDSPAEFLTNEQAIKDTKLYLRYMVARYGYSTNIFAWELFSEIDATSAASNVDDIVNWHTEMADYLKAIDPYDHMVTTSTANRPDSATDTTQLKNRINALDVFDFASIHFYNYWDISNLANYQQSYQKAYGKPVLFGECGLTTAGEGSGLDADLINFHQQNWIGVMGGGAGTPASWYWQKFDELNGYNEFKAVSVMADTIPWSDSSMKSIKADDLALSNSQVKAYGYSGSNYANLWLYDTAYKHIAASHNGVFSDSKSTTAVDIQNLSFSVAIANGNYTVKWLDTYTGEIISSSKATATNGSLTVTAPTFNKDIAVIITK